MNEPFVLQPPIVKKLKNDNKFQFSSHFPFRLSFGQCKSRERRRMRNKEMEKKRAEVLNASFHCLQLHTYDSGVFIDAMLGYAMVCFVVIACLSLLLRFQPEI